MPSYGTLEGKEREEWEKSGVRISYRDLPNNPEQKRKYSVPFNHVLHMDKYDLLIDIKKIYAPIILIAGELDELVTPSDVKDIFDNANEPKNLIVIPQIGHDYRKVDKEIIIVNSEILKLLNS